MKGGPKEWHFAGIKDDVFIVAVVGIGSEDSLADAIVEDDAAGDDLDALATGCKEC